jgi:hypothetical protein
MTSVCLDGVQYAKRMLISRYMSKDTFYEAGGVLRRFIPDVPHTGRYLTAEEAREISFHVVNMMPREIPVIDLKKALAKDPTLNMLKNEMKAVTRRERNTVQTSLLALSRHIPTELAVAIAVCAV